MKVQASLPNLRISPRKTRLVTRALVGASVDVALLQLRKQTKKASAPLVTLLESAIANATNNQSLNRSDLVIDDIRVGDGPKLKRWLPRAFGRATPLIRRGSNVTVIITSRVAPVSEVKKPARIDKSNVAGGEKTPAKKATVAKKAPAKRVTETKKA